MKIETEMAKCNKADQASSSSAKCITADESERNFVRQEPGSGDDSCDDEYATDVESEVAAVNNDVNSKISSKIDMGEEECATTVSSSKSISSNSRNKDDARQLKKLSSFRQPRHFCFSSSCSDLNAYTKPTQKTSFTAAELAAKKESSAYTFDKTTFVYKSPYGLYNIQIKKKTEPSPRPRALTSTGHGFNKSTFDYTSPYNEQNLMASGLTGLQGLPGGVGRRAVAAPVYVKRLSIGENPPLQRVSSETTREDFSLNDFEDNDFEVLITVNTDDDDDDDDENENEEPLELYDVYQNNAELSDLESVRNPSQKSSRSASPNGSTCSTYIRVSGLRSLDSSSDAGSVGKKDKADDVTRHKNEIFEAFDGETIAAMDPESFAEYLGSQSLIDMMASAGAGAGTGTGASASAGAAAGKEGDRDTDTVTTHTSHHVST